MEIKKEYYEREGVYNFEFIKDNKSLKIFFGGNLDLYMTLGTDKTLPYGENISIDFDITKEDYEIYELFDTLYNDIINCNVFDEYKLNRGLKNNYVYRDLVDKNKNITWISDDGPREVEDRVIISKKDKDTYKLMFIRNDKELDFGFKSPYSIAIRFRNSGSWYEPFNVCFMKMFKKLQKLDINYHQYSIDEYMYIRKLNKSNNKL